MASFTCPAGAICSAESKTSVGATQQKVNGRGGKPAIRTVGGTPIFHRTVTTVKQDGAGNISGGETVVYIIKNGSWQPAAISKDGGKTYSFSDPKYPTMDGVAGSGLQKELQNPNGAIHKNTDDQASRALDKAGITKPQDKAKIVDATKGNGADGATDIGDGSKPVDLQIEGSGLSRNKEGSFGSYIYPLDIGSTKQDVVKFTMLKYEPRKFQTGQDNLGGFAERTKNRTRLGTVVLPIPSGISETNGASWGSDTMDPGQALLANIALAGIKGGFGAAADTTGNALEGAAGNTGEVKNAVATKFAEAATGIGNLLSRTQGAIFNPNMELLFNAPTLRPFNFTFKMSARSDREAKQIIQIIRFFKQGMSPQRSSSNLYLKSPHTFNINYLYRPKGSDADHPYIGAIKECALQNFVVNYTPEGQYATFHDGVLVSYEIQMTFQELEPIFNEDYGNSGSSMPEDLLFRETQSSKP
jgi:hypothetical protein